MGALRLASILALLCIPLRSTAEPYTWAVDPATLGVLVEDHRVPVVHVTLEFPVGTWSPWVRDHHASEAFSIQLHDSAETFRRRADLLGADLSLTMGSRVAQIQAASLKDDLDELLALLRDVLLNADFDRDELKRRQASQSIGWGTAQRNPQFRRTQAVGRLLFRPSDPRRLAVEEPPAILTKPDRLAAPRDTVVGLPGRVVAFAGDLTPDEAERAAAGKLPPAIPEAPAGIQPSFEPVVPPAELPLETRVELRQINQVQFSYSRESLTYEDDSYPAFLVADHVLGGHFYSRLYVALRHEGGDTYGVGTSGHGSSVSQAYSVFTFTRTENAASTETKLQGVLKTFHEDGITEEERLAAVSHLIGRRAFSRQSPGQILGTYLVERREGLPAGFFDSLPQLAAALSLDEINSFIQDFYAPDGFRVIKVEPR